MKDEWTILDLKNPPDLTVDYQWEQKCGTTWNRLKKHTLVTNILLQAMSKGNEYRYHRNRTLKSINPYEKNSYFFKVWDAGFRAALSGEYDDIELED